MNPVSLVSIAQYGIALFSITAIIYIVTLFVKFIKEYMIKAIGTQQALKDAIHEMLLFFKLRNGKR